MYQLIDGKKLAEVVTEELTRQILDEHLDPQLAVILVGDDPASHLYVKLKAKACERAGITMHQYLINENEDEQKIIGTIAFLNTDKDIDAILIQLPLPAKFDQQKIVSMMDYRKDVDGFHKKNIEGYLAGKKQRILPGLSLAIWHLIASTGPENYQGKHVALIGKSDAFLQPTKKILADQGMLVSIIKPDAADLAEQTKTASIIVTAVGKPGLIKADMISGGATVIDVGVSKLGDKTVGDVDFEHVAPKTKYITPAPGGVGPMTVAMLLFNTVILARERKS